MSEIKVDTLTGKTTANDITVTVGASATAKLEQGLAKAWMNINSTGTVAIRDSFNISSIIDHAVGAQTGEATNSFAGTDNMSPTASAWNNLLSNGKYGGSAGIRNSSSYWVGAFWSGTTYDVAYTFSSVHGDLA